MISFARGAPAPECLDAELLADCARSAVDGDPAVLAYGPGGGYAPLREWLGARHGVDPGRVIVTNGGLQGFVFYAEELLAERPGPRARRGADLRPAAEDPRAARRRGRAGRDGRRGARPRRARARARRRRDELPLHDPDLPEPERADALDRAAAARRRAGAGARRAGARGRPLRPRPLRGRAAAVAARARGRRPRHLRVLVLEDGRARRARRLVRRAGRAGRPDRGPRRLELHLAAVPHPGDGLRADRPRRLRAEPGADPRAAEDPPRRDARGARARARRRRRRWSEPEGGYFLWVDLPADAAELLARAEAAGVTFVKGADFYPDGAGGSTSARLAFSFASPSEIDDGRLDARLAACASDGAGAAARAARRRRGRRGARAGSPRSARCAPPRARSSPTRPRRCRR